MQNEILEKALEYLEKKISVIPVGKDKIPLIKWEEFQKRLPSKEEVESWWEHWPDANVGIVTGKISGLTVVDVEKGGDISIFPKTATVKTGGDGWHLYYAYHPINNKARIFPLTDIRGDGGYVVAPPSVHASGKKYESLNKIQCSPFPTELFKEGKTKKEGNVNLERLLNETIQEGERNNSAASIAGKLLLRFKESEWESQAWPLFNSWNKIHNQPPLPEQELLTIFKSISQAEQRRRKSGENVGEPQLLEQGEKFVISVPIEDGFAVFEFEDLDYSSRSLDTIVRCSLEIPGTTPRGFVQRINILSSSAREGFVRQLKDSFGGDKKMPWPLIFSQACEILERAAKKQLQEESFVMGEESDTTYLLKPFIEEGSPNIIFGRGGSGKTYLALRIAISLATGLPFLGITPEKTISSLFIDYENTKNIWSSRLTKLLKGMKTEVDVTNSLFYFSTKGIPLYDLKYQILEAIRRRNANLIIIDSAALACGGEPESAEVANKLFNSLTRLKTTSLLIAHETKNADNKNKTPFGSVFFYNCARNIWNVENSQEQDESVIHVGLFHRKSNNDRLYGVKSARIYFGDGFVDINPEEVTKWSKEMSMREQIIDILNENESLTISDLAKEIGKGTSTLKNTLADLKKREVVISPERGVWMLKSRLENKTTDLNF